MARAGDIIDNPVTRERVKWHLTAEDTGGALARLEIHVQPGGAVSARHVHPRSEERFEVIAGTLAVEIDGVHRELRAGDRATVPAGAGHRWPNSGDDEVRFMVEVEPPLRFEEVLDTMFSLAREGRTDADGVPHPLQLAVIANEYRDELYGTSLPLWLQRPLFAVLSACARRRGVRAVATPVAA